MHPCLRALTRSRHLPVTIWYMKKTVSTPAPTTPVAKHSQRGKYVYKPLLSVVIVCACGNKYVSTRKGQKTCIRCLIEG